VSLFLSTTDSLSSIGQQGTSFLNVISLAIGIAAALLITLYFVKHNFSTKAASLELKPEVENKTSGDNNIDSSSTNNPKSLTPSIEAKTREEQDNDERFYEGSIQQQSIPNTLPDQYSKKSNDTATYTDSSLPKPEDTIVLREQEQQSSIKYIGYDPINIFAQSEPFKFPYVVMPKPKSVIKFPRKGRARRKGYKEDDLKAYIEKYFRSSFQVFTDRSVLVKSASRPYEPDITIINEKEGINLFIDIEIDEPYEGSNDISLRKATHYQYVDSPRNNSFASRGWIVVRFAEIQVHTAPLSCCLFLGHIIQSIYPKFQIPEELLKARPLEQLPQWTKEQAEEWSRQKYRERYLGIDRFGHTSEGDEFQQMEETEIEAKVEELVEDIPNPVPVQRSPTTSNSILLLVNNVINEGRYLSFTYNDQRLIIKPTLVKGNGLRGYCYIKNIERDFKLSEITAPVRKQSPFSLEAKGPSIGLSKIKTIISTAIQYQKIIRIRYTRSAWTNMNVDQSTGEIIMEVTEAEESIRTINNVQLSINALDREHVQRYNLNADYITAYCNKRSESRTFKMDRISDIAILDI
jgi:hypothetical protein